MHKLRSLLLLGILLPGLSPAQSTATTVPLDHCIQQALVNDRRVQLADTDLGMAEARRDEANAMHLPKVRAMADLRHYTDLPYQLLPASFFGGPEGAYREVQFGTPNNIALNVQVQLPLVDASNWERAHVAREGEQMAALQHERTREEVVLEVSNAYYNAQVLHTRIAILDSNVTNTERLLRNVELLHQQLLVRGTDVDRLRLQRDQLLTQRARLVAQYEQVLDLLRLMMGLPAETPLAPEPVTTVTIANPEPAVSTVGLRMAEQGIRLRTAEIRLLKRSRLPSLNGYGLYGTTGFGPIGTESRYDLYPIGYLGATLQVPLFNGTVITSKVRQQELELERATVLRDAAADREALEQRRTERDEALARQALTDGGSQLELAERRRRTTALQHREGTATLTDLVLADQAVREAQQLTIDALVQLRKAQLERTRLNGTLLKTHP